MCDPSRDEEVWRDKRVAAVANLVEDCRLDRIAAVECQEDRDEVETNLMAVMIWPVRFLDGNFVR